MNILLLNMEIYNVEMEKYDVSYEEFFNILFAEWGILIITP